MKTRIFTLREWNEETKNGNTKEGDIINGIHGHLAIECPDCGSKLWQGKYKPNVACRNCHFTGHREVADE